MLANVEVKRGNNADGVMPIWKNVRDEYHLIGLTSANWFVLAPVASNSGIVVCNSEII